MPSRKKARYEFVHSWIENNPEIESNQRVDVYEWRNGNDLAPLCSLRGHTRVVGLIDEIASDKADAIEKCKKFIKKFDKILPSARTTSKLRMRQDLLDKMHRDRHLDTAEILEYIQRPEVQQALDIYMQNLKAGKKSK